METTLLMAKPPRQHKAYRRTFIKEWREHRGWSQARLGEEIDKSDAYVAQVENGTRRYNQDILEDIAEALGLSVATLISKAPPPAGMAEEPDIFYIWETLTPEQRALGARLLGSIKKN